RDELVFHTNPQSRGRIVRWMLEELGQPYRTVVQEYGTGMKSPGYLAINPMGKVPAIEHRGVVVTEARRSAPTSPTPSPKPASHRRPTTRCAAPGTAGC